MARTFVFTSDVYPECDRAPIEEYPCNALKVKAAEESKVKAIIFDRLLYRHWNMYKRGMRTHIFVTAAWPPTVVGRPEGDMDLRKVPIDLTPGDHDVPPFSLGGQDDYAFSPDGQEVCYTSNHDEVGALSTNNDLFIVSVSGGATKKITDNPASDSTPLYSPDGKYIAYRAQVRPGYESDRFRLMLYNRRSGHIRNMTENFDRWVGTYVWDPDSSKIYFVAEEKGDSPVYSIALDTAVIGGDAGNDTTLRVAKNNIKMIVPGHNDDLAVTHDGKTLVFTRMSVKFPDEIFRATLPQPGAEGGGATVFETQEVCTDSTGKIKPEGCKSTSVEKSEAQLTDLNHAVLSRVAMSPLESFWFSGASNDKVEGFLIKPPDFDAKKKYPVKFLIHGGPQGAWGDDWSYRWNPELFAANGYVVVMINFHGSTGYGQKFIDAINGNWGAAPFDDLMKGLDDAEHTYPFIDKDRECALGASYGGYMANWILGHSNRFKCIVSHDGTFNTESAWGTTEELWFAEWEFKGPLYNNRELYRKWSPHLSALNFKTPTLVVHGQLDYRLDVSEGFQLFTTLQRLKVPSEMLYFPDEGHWVLKPQNSQLWYKTVNAWVDQWTKK